MASSRDDEPGADRQRRLARTVTFTTIGVLLLAAAVQVEAWPLTAYRLFSVVRTDSQTTYQLVTVGVDGTEAPLRVDPGNPVLDTTRRQYADLPGLSASRRREKVLAWVAAAHLNPADVQSVRLERATRVMDPETQHWVETSRAIVVEVEL